MSHLFLTILLASIFLAICLTGMAISFLLTGKNKLIRGTCGYDPTKKQNRHCNKKNRCSLCTSKIEPSANEKINK